MYTALDIFQIWRTQFQQSNTLQWPVSSQARFVCQKRHDKWRTRVIPTLPRQRSKGRFCRRGIWHRSTATIVWKSGWKIKSDLSKYKLLVFRNQGTLSGDTQLRITGYFGDVEERGFEQHPKSPDRLILRVSNDEDEGFRDFGCAGFHIDGTFMEMPNTYSLYHIIATPTKGSTGMYAKLLFTICNSIFNMLCYN